MEATDQDIEEWNEVFQELIQEVKPWHTWTLVTDKDLLPDAPQQGWSQYQQKTFARFQCSSCARSWASAHVQVLFHMHWNRKKHRGRVKMRVFSQRCRRCAQPRFEAAEFTLENIRRTLTNLVFRILRKCYKEGFEAMEDMPTVKDTSLEGPHDSLNCEACLQGFCAQSGLSLAPQRSGLPSLPSPSEDTRATATCSHRPCSPPPKVDKLLVSAVDSKLPKADPKVSHASKPSAAPRYPTEEVSPTLTVTPKVPNPLRADPKVRDWLAIHMPSPTDSRTAVDTAVGNPRVMSREPSPALPLPANSRWDRGLSSSNQTRPPICQANTRVPTPPLPESCDCSPLQSCTPVHLCLRCPCCLLLVLIIGVVLWYWLP